MEAYLYYTLFILLQVAFIIQLYYLWVVQHKFINYTIPEIIKSSSQKVSVIICARNEAKNLKENLPYILQQKGLDYEVVVVNDCSSDQSDEVLRLFQAQYPNLKVVVKEEHPRFKTGKKFAATLGIKAASHEILVFTDADCKPSSDYWLVNLCEHYDNPQIEIVLGFSPYEKKSGLLNKLIRYETFQTALNYFSFSLSGDTYMGVGRNLSYKKSLFFKGKGFAAHMHIPSGDDDLFVNQNATTTNTAIEIRPETHMLSEPKLTWSAYWIQKMRHLGAGKFYKASHQRSLSLQVISAISFYMLLLACYVLQIEVIIISVLLFLRLLAQIFIFYKSMLRLKSKDLIYWVLILDLLYYLYLSILSIRGLFRKKIVWK
ncbi:glycosyltransferase [Pedobacter puniceum]|uniref:Glycosyltransferase n=1 Tax=Pedobacter puniceum TaxID=2666136 RepID=A0A7K0FLM4_9SPHI|nr:glycosyltransferase [Pedobacter puniceum]MRX45997.1 glycosyltransferase [Pedobacter puniceum]